MGSKYFVSDMPVPVYEFDPTVELYGEDGQPIQPNIIWIKPKMDLKTRGNVTGELFRQKDEKIEMVIGRTELALLINNIVRWEGPDLDGVPCTPEFIERLQGNDHIDKVLAEINDRNVQKPSPNPKSPEPNGSTKPGEHESVALVKSV